MRKLLPLLTCSILACNAIHAQKLPIKIGFKGGVNIAHLKRNLSTDTWKSPNKTSLQAGAFATISLSQLFSVQPELLWNDLGTKYLLVFNEMGTPIRATGAEYMSYISLPVLLKYQLPVSGLRVYAGPQLSYLLSDKYEDNTNRTTRSNKERFTDFDFSALGGLEYEIPHTHISISARYQFGITSILKEDIGASRHRVASFILGYRFN